MTAASPTMDRHQRTVFFDAAAKPGRSRLRRKHMLMLALAVEVLVFGVCHAGDDRRPGVIVDVPAVHGHTIT